MKTDNSVPVVLRRDDKQMHIVRVNHTGFPCFQLTHQVIVPDRVFRIQTDVILVEVYRIKADIAVHIVMNNLDRCIPEHFPVFIALPELKCELPVLEVTLLQDFPSTQFKIPLCLVRVVKRDLQRV